MPSRQSYISEPSPIERDLLREFRQEEPLVIFDIGSCEGEDAIRYARLFPNSRVFAAEPLPHNLALLRQHVNQYGAGNVAILATAMSDEIGEADFFVSSGRPPDAGAEDWDYGNKSSSLLAPGLHTKVHSWLEFKDRVRVPVTTLAATCLELGLERVDFIHLDVQGAELMVLNGAGPLLASTRVIWLEVERIELYEGQPLKREVESFMESRGFVKRRDTVHRISGDQLYVRRSDGDVTTAAGPAIWSKARRLAARARRYLG